MRADADLVAALGVEDEIAASEFYERFQPRVMAIARRRRVPLDDCADVAQEVLVDAIRQIRQGRFRSAASLSTWLHPIIHGKISDYFRRFSRSQAIALDSINEADLTRGSECSREDILWVRHALERLSEEDRLILRLHEFERLTLEEIGTLRGLKKSAVGDHLRKARDNFRVALREGGSRGTPRRLKE